ncbi:MAG: GerMN domain-containing protein [Clostridiales bacterium]|nr:GerMN domain-containing protein [Clostridiales bacterium]
MKLKLQLLLLAGLLIFTFPQKAGAESVYLINYLAFDENGREYWTTGEVYTEAIDSGQIAYSVFSAMFGGENTYCIPAGVTVLGTEIREGNLFLDLSAEILDYGGSFYEERLKAQLISTALGLPGVASLSLLVNGRRAGLSEGGEIWGADSFSLELDNQP